MTTPPHEPPPGQGGYGPPRFDEPGRPLGQPQGRPGPSAPGPGYGPPAPGYGPPPPGWAPAGGPPPGWAGPPQTESKAIVVLVLGIASFVVFPVVPAIVALAMAPDARRTIQASGGRLTGEGLVQGGVIASWINLGLALAALLFFVFFVVVLAAAGTS